MPKVIGIIPSRYGSKRFPGKALALIAGVPLVVRVLQNAKKSTLLSDVVVASDDVRIIEAVEQFGGRAIRTANKHVTGSDRVAEAAAQFDCDFIVNIQGDEPFISPKIIDTVVELLGDPTVVMSTACSPLDEANASDPNIVKVVLDCSGHAVYFSRSRIPYQRTDGVPGPLYRHIGIYGFKRNFLLRYASLSRTPLEQAESLEQLRALEHGYRIRVAVVESEFVGIDCEDDLTRAQEILNKRRFSNAQ